jgi:hypothetical protein
MSQLRRDTNRGERVLSSKLSWKTFELFYCYAAVKSERNMQRTVMYD